MPEVDTFDRLRAKTRNLGTPTSFPFCTANRFRLKRSG
jgi:hypothetical protein